MALTQQSNWLSASLPQFAPLFEATDKLACRWRLVAILADRADANASHIQPFVKIPGIGDNWESRELELPSRTAALRLSKRMAMRISRDMAKEKGHMAVWHAPIAKSEIGLVCALLGIDKPKSADEIAAFPSALLCSVWPCLESEQLEEFLGAKDKAEAEKQAKKEAAAAKREAAKQAKADKAAALAAQIEEEQTTAADIA